MKKAICIMLLGVLPIFVFCKEEPDRVTVQHILIALKGSIPKEDLTRNRDEAELLAKEILRGQRTAKTLMPWLKNILMISIQAFIRCQILALILIKARMSILVPGW